MSKGKRKPPKQGIVNSRTRDSQRLALEPHTRDEPRLIERVAKDAGKPNLSYGSEVDKVVPAIEPFIEMQMSHGYTLDQLDQRRAEVSKEEKKLDPEVKLLFELERDGVFTPTEYKDQLLQSHVTSDNIFDAIELGIKAWAPTFLSKEH